MSSEQLAQILQLSAENPPPENANPAMLREWFEAINAQTPIADGSMIEHISLGDFKGELTALPGSDQSRLLIYFHGGGFMFGSPRSHRVVASNLARSSGATVLSVDYRLAPEHPAPTAHHDAFAAYKWALGMGYVPASIAISGDSAGGNLALATVVRARNAGLPLPSSIVLMSPALDLADEGDSHHTIPDAPRGGHGALSSAHRRRGRRRPRRAAAVLFRAASQRRRVRHRDVGGR